MLLPAMVVVLMCTGRNVDKSTMNVKHCNGFQWL
jgi:hypothetical protein